jgi:superfamily II DNA or RNA helicase
MPIAKHPKSRFYAQQRIFSGITSFHELEKRISSLPDEKSRGDAFEVFVEAYLTLERKHEAEIVWPFDSVPSDIKSQLNLPDKDYGVDGVLKTKFGKINAYQVKFRTNRGSLTWSELSTFIGLADSPNIQSRILITNCEDIAKALNDRQGFFCIRGTDLDRLDAENFKAIEAWLEGADYRPPKKQPMDHQKEALAAIETGLEKHDRVSAIMACGSGKTLVALWALEKINSKLILVLVPSLALLRQILHEWLQETSIRSLAYLCVCSDATVTEGIDDSIITQQSDLDFEVTTKSEIVREFLDAKFEGSKIIFSTYQSAQVVGQALKEGEVFDFAVFDEAHKTSGREGRNYAYALENNGIPIKKRLFLTATPRHYNPHKKDKKTDDAKLVFSMDKPEVYGPQVFRLSFAEAARRGIICGYKVIISIITNEMVTNEILCRGEVLVNGDPVRAPQVANQIALRDAIAKYDLNKIFTFHKTVKSAQSFVGDGNEGVKSHVQDFKTYHVSGEMPTAKRERQMRDFRSAKRAVMSNARCLTEGVDVPSVDMVAFLSPRRSRVDIVQATGRAMRRDPSNPKKSTGYVLVPLYVELANGESVDEAVNRADFEEIWDVLHSLQEQDEVLSDIISSYGEMKGQGKGFNDSRFHDRIEFGGACVDLDDIRIAVTTRCLDSLYSSWDSWFGKLKEFKDKFGHCNVETGWVGCPGLWSWVSSQRTRRNSGNLSEERIARLDGIGFVWDYQSAKSQDTWMKWYKELEEFKDKFGHCNVETDWDGCPGLWSWVSSQRTRRNSGNLTEERIAQLDRIGFVWDYQSAKSQDTWMKWYRELEKYVKEHGNSHVPRTYVNKKLASWVWIQRQRRKGTNKRSGPLTPEQESKLNNIGFYWDARDGKWEENFEKLKTFYKINGHFEVSFADKPDMTLISWVRMQRSSFSDGSIDSARKEKLKALGFNWSAATIDQKWEKMFAKLNDYNAQVGDSDVPAKWEGDPQLANWVSYQRDRFNKKLLTEEQIKLLNGIHFTWKHRERGSFEDRVAEVAAFKEKYGHCNIPQDDTKIGRFINNVRVKYKKGHLPFARIQALERLGFQWSSNQKSWNQMLNVYKESIAQAVQAEISSGQVSDPQLANWISRQRFERKKGELPNEKIQILDELGFQWERNSA